jgi:hypothetical protein
MSTTSQDNQVKAGYAELDDTGRTSVRAFIEKFEKSNEQEKRRLNEDLTLVFNKSLGPKSSSVCPCCGR